MARPSRCATLPPNYDRRQVTRRGLFTETTAGIESCKLAFSAAKTQYLNLFEASYLRRTLDRHAGNVSMAAEAARVDRKTFYRLLRKHRMEPKRFRE
jgi:DNA-binding NtrC family response regulator